MPRIKSTEIQLRDQEIIEAARRNIPRRDIAETYGISQARVSQIVTSNLDPKFPDEDLRAWLLEGYFGDMATLQEIKDGPGRAITSGKGDHVRDGNTGDFAYDPSPRIDAVRTFAQVRKNVATLMGSEKVAAKPLEETQGLQEALKWLEETSKINEQLKAQNLLLQSRLATLEAQLPVAEIVELPLGHQGVTWVLAQVFLLHLDDHPAASPSRTRLLAVPAAGARAELYREG